MRILIVIRSTPALVDQLSTSVTRYDAPNFEIRLKNRIRASNVGHHNVIMIHHQTTGQIESVKLV